MYDFSRCKLCGRHTAAPTYQLKQMSLYVCANCDFHFIDALDDCPEDPQESPLLTASARSYIEKQLPQNIRQMEKALRFVTRHVTPRARHCLDIGAGAGVFAALLRGAGAIPQGIEPQQVFREFAREKYQLSLRRELIDEACWQEELAGYFDVVTIWDTLEHVNFPAETLQAAGRVLKPGGYLFLDTPSRDAWFYRVSEWSYRFSGGTRPLLLNSLYSPDPYRHKQIFTAGQLQALLKTCGVTIVGHSPLHRSRNKLVLACRKHPAPEPGALCPG